MPPAMEWVERTGEGSAPAAPDGAWLRTGRGVRRSLYGFTVRTALFTVAWALLFVLTVVPFTTEQIQQMLIALTGVVLTAFAGVWPIMVAETRAMVAYVDEGEDPEAAFAQTMRFPIRIFVIGISIWSGGGLLLVVALSWIFPDFPSAARALICAAAVSGGLISQIFSFVWLKSRLAPLRERLALEVLSGDRRAELAGRLPLATKLTVAITGLVVVNLALGVVVAEVRTGDRADREWLAFSEQLLARAAEAVEAGSSPEGWVAAMQALLPDASIELGLLDRAALDDETRLPSGATRADPPGPGVMALVRERPEAGDAFYTMLRRRVAWRALGEAGPILVISTPRTATLTSAASVIRDYALLGSFMVAVVVVLVVFGARDITRAGEVLGRLVEGVASGDLRVFHVYESEDEFGGLARGFTRMAGSLRSIVGQISELTADVDAASESLRAASEDVAEVSRHQVEEIRSAAASVQSLHGKVKENADSIAAFAISMESSGSAIDLLRAMGEGLSEDASILSGKVGDVAASISQMSGSIRLVGEQTGALTDSSSGTTASMEQMAVTAREIDRNTAESLRLADNVSVAADDGRDRVAETIQGIEEIRRQTESVDRTIQSLVDRSKQIGSIIEVIESVADETGLLALNAAIIAAQSGDQGRGFMVVADQVKQLAKRVLDSTKEISDLVTRVQDETADSAAAISEGLARVESGVQRAMAARESLAAIYEASQESRARIHEVVEATAGNARLAEHVISLMSKVNEGAEHIHAAASEHSSAASLVLRSSSAMEEIAGSVKSAAADQSRSLVDISKSISVARDATNGFHDSLQVQHDDCEAAVELLDQLKAHTASNQETTGKMNAAIEALATRADALRTYVSRFRL